MDWLPLIPAFIIGMFLLITWNALSPIRFFKQQRSERQRQRKKWEEQSIREAEEEERLLNELKK